MSGISRPLLGRALLLALLAGHWIGNSGHRAGALLLLGLSATAIARWRLALPGWSGVIDLGGCLLVAPYWPGAWYGAALAVFDATLSGALPLLAVTAALMTLLAAWSPPLVMVLVLSGFCGWLVRCWSHDQAALRSEADSERRYRYEAEALQRDLITSAAQTSQVTDLMARQRISQALHDHVGHEVTAAILALQAFERLWRESDPQAAQLLTTVQTRLEAGARQLRETVYNLHPVVSFGLERFADICDGFQALPLTLSVHGDAGCVQAYQWHILEACLKEALTNVLRHASATQVAVTLDIGPHILRLSVHNDGAAPVNHPEVGIGLRSLRQRVRLGGGSLSTTSQNGFRLVCVLPLSERSS